MSEYDAWAPVYDAWGAAMPDDVAYYLSLAREANGPIVELAVGTGRVAIPVVRETGKPFTDESLEFVYVARKP